MPTRSRLTILDPRMRTRLEASGLRRYEDYVSCTRGELVGTTGSAEKRRIVLDGAGPGEHVYLKIYRCLRRGGRSGLLRDKARIETRNYRILAERCGINVPEVVAHGSRRRRWRLADAFIMTRGVANAVPLDGFILQRWPDRSAGARDPARHRLLEEIADLVSRMHAAGFFHVDLQGRNLLVVDTGGPRPSVHVIDSARGSMRRWGVHQAHGRLRDLSSLYKLASRSLTRGEGIRWLRHYLGVRRLSAPEHHVLVASILQDRCIKDNGVTG